MSSEAAFLQMVRDLAALRGWYAYHTHDSRRSEPGFPDLVLVRAKDRRLIFAELKTDTGLLTPRQEEVLGMLRCLVNVVRYPDKDPGWDVDYDPDEPRLEVFVWRPVDFQRIDAVLR